MRLALGLNYIVVMCIQLEVGLIGWTFFVGAESPESYVAGGATERRMDDLRTLAEQYVALTGQIEAVRRAMLACLSNGAAAPRPFSGAVRRGPTGRATAEAERRIVELLGNQPDLGTGAVAKATGANLQTTADRLKRLRKAGKVAGGGSLGWRVATAAG